jgi:hypothetical protein
MLQGSSSADPIYNFNSDVSLNPYHQLACGATFTHPGRKETITIHATQYVDDKAATINKTGIPGIPTNNKQRDIIFKQAKKTQTLGQNCKTTMGS